MGVSGAPASGMAVAEAGQCGEMSAVGLENGTGRLDLDNRCVAHIFAANQLSWQLSPGAGGVSPLRMGRIESQNASVSQTHTHHPLPGDGRSKARQRPFRQFGRDIHKSPGAHPQTPSILLTRRPVHPQSAHGGGGREAVAGYRFIDLMNSALVLVALSLSIRNSTACRSSIGCSNLRSSHIFCSSAGPVSSSSRRVPERLMLMAG